MRVLVEQTYCEAVKWLDRLGLLAGSADWTEPGSDGLPTKASQLDRGTSGQRRGYEREPGASRTGGWASENGDRGTHPIAVHLLLGGEERSDWALWPERDAILIGTQDMLVSRALNRGYAAGRARWPQEFGLLNSDCLWVFDEIQIMDTSLATSLQLDAWRRSLRLRSSPDEFPTEQTDHLARPCHSLWMSATMAKHWLECAVDWLGHVDAAWTNRHQLSDPERTDKDLRSGQLFEIPKQLSKASILALERPKTKDNRADKADAKRKQTEYLNRLAEHIAKAENHAASGLTLVIVNTVDRATNLFELLRKQPSLEGVSTKLIHSRFRPREREEWSGFLSQKDNVKRILISTQVVEAGVDLSASVLYTELAPWASLVQRFGRCARYPGETGCVTWLDLDLGTEKTPIEHWARPYSRAENVAAREKLEKLGDVGLDSLSRIKQAIDTELDGREASHLFPYEPRFVPRDKDLFDLFDTTPDLTGADVDVSRFIRDGEELDVQVFWRDPEGDPLFTKSDLKRPLKKLRPQRRELCPVPFQRFREELPALRKAGRIWRRNYRKGWEPIDSWDTELVYPGQVFLLEASCGGYSRKLGWTGNPQDRVELEDPVLLEDIDNRADASTDTEDSEDLSEISGWLTIEEHCRDVGRKMAELLTDAGLSDSEQRILLTAARLHDWGKVHEAFQAKLKPDLLALAQEGDLGGQPAAKAPDGRDRQMGKRDEAKNAWRRDRIGQQSGATSEADKDRRRAGHRHELASALAILETLCSAQPTHNAFSWPEGVDTSSFGEAVDHCSASISAEHPLARELADLTTGELDLLVYLVASHHGKVRMSLRNSPDDEREDVPDPCPSEKRQARGVRDGDILQSCRLPAAHLDDYAPIDAPTVTLSLDPMELGLSRRYGASWRERTQLLLERMGPFRLGYLEALLRAADCRASKEEDERGRSNP
jgi:CRISPR-associated endonuclease/helicase Cas3